MSNKILYNVAVYFEDVEQELELVAPCLLLSMEAEDDINPAMLLDETYHFLNTFLKIELIPSFIAILVDDKIVDSSNNYVASRDIPKRVLKPTLTIVSKGEN